MRDDLYGALSSEFHEEEMEKIFTSKEWHCQFIEDINGQVIGFFELSSRNIVVEKYKDPRVFSCHGFPRNLSNS